MSNGRRASQEADVPIFSDSPLQLTFLEKAQRWIGLTDRPVGDSGVDFSTEKLASAQGCV